MIRFFHYWLTCPSCHEPHIDSQILKPLIRENSLIRCTNKECRITFPPLLKIPNPDYYKIPKELAIKGVPLFWEIVPNPVERSYIDLFVQPYISNDLILITWPWNTVKCIPLIISTILKYQEVTRPILVFSKYIQKGTPDQGIKSPAHNILSKCLVAIDDSLDLHNGSETSLQSDKSSVEDNKLFEVIQQMVKCTRTSLTCYKIDGKEREVFKKLSDEEIPETADVDSIQRFSVIPKGKMQYNRDWMSFILKNSQYVSRQTRDTFIEIFEPMDFPSEKITGKKVVFIRTRSDTSPTMDLLKQKIDTPSIVIIEDLEYFLHNYRIKEFFNFLHELKGKSIVLMFSTNPRLRFLQLDLLDEFEDTIEFHCWDTRNRLDWMKNQIWFDSNESQYPNPGSSKKDEIRGGE